MYTYQLTLLIINNIGDRSCECLPENDPYLGSGRAYFLNAKKKYGKKNFRIEILEIYLSKKEAFDKQEKYIQKYNTLAPNGYNISPKGGLCVKDCHSEETKKKIRNRIQKKSNLPYM